MHQICVSFVVGEAEIIIFLNKFKKLSIQLLFCDILVMFKVT